MTNREVVLLVHLSPVFLNTATINETFEQSETQDSFRHILNRSARMYESSDLLFFRTTTEIQSGPEAFDKSRLVMIFLTNLRVTDI